MIRKGVNRLVGITQSRIARRNAYKKQTLVLANNWDGSVQQFYHFLLGYLMPLSLWLDRNPSAQVLVRDCGPMNIWLDAIGRNTSLQTIPTGSALHVVVGNRMKHTVLQGLDDPAKFKNRTLVKGADSIQMRLGMGPSLSSKEPAILVIDRATSEDFYHQHGSETEMSGKERRHVPNLKHLPDVYSGVISMKVVDLARLSPHQQIQVAKESSTLIGQHGAGLAHMLWMAPGSHIIEIAPPLPTQVQDIFSLLAKKLGHSYTRIPQQGVHAEVDLGLILQFLESAKSN